MTAHVGPVRCLTGYCYRPATHWHDGAPRCLECAWNAIEDEGRAGVEPVPAPSGDLARFYVDRGMDPSARRPS